MARGNENLESRDVRATYDDEDSELYESGSDSVKRIYGSAKNFAEFGLPSEHSDEKISYYFYPTWRSQLGLLIWFVISCILTVILSNYLSLSVFTGDLFSIGGTRYQLSLPLFIFLPSFVLGKILFNIYNSRFIIDDSGIEAQVGLVSVYLRQPRLRYEDIRGVEPEQSLMERILGIGRVLVGSAMTADVEITMEGVPNPRAIQLLINKERDRRLQQARKSGVDHQRMVTGD